MDAHRCGRYPQLTRDGLVRMAKDQLAQHLLLAQRQLLKGTRRITRNLDLQRVLPGERLGEVAESDGIRSLAVRADNRIAAV